MQTSTQMPMGTYDPNTRTYANPAVNPGQAETGCYVCSDNEKTGWGWCGLVSGSIAVLLIAVLVGLSFVPVGFDQLAVFNNAITGSIDLNHTYSNGMYYALPGVVAITFPRPVQFITLDLNVGTTSGLSMYLNVSVEYQIIQSNITYIYRNFGVNGYATQIQNVVTSTYHSCIHGGRAAPYSTGIWYQSAP
jgi:hypothetical protein